MDSKEAIEFLNLHVMHDYRPQYYDKVAIALAARTASVDYAIAAIRERDELRERIERACELAEKVGPYAKKVMWPVFKGEDA